MAKKYEEMSDAELDQELAKKMPASQPPQQDNLDQLSDAELDAMLLQKQQSDAQNMPVSIKEPMTVGTIAKSSPMQALYSGIENAATLGTAPTIAGLAAGAGGLVGSLQSGAPIGEAFKTAKESFSQARNEAIEDEAKAAKEQTAMSMIGNVAGSVLTAPFLPAKGVMGAIKAGGLMGAGEAIGKAKDLGEAATSVAAGGVSGGIAGLAGNALIKVGSATVDKIKSLVPSKAFAKIGETLTGVNQKEIQNYMANTRKIDQLSKKVAGDYQEAVNVAKEKIMLDVRNARQNLSNKISNELEKAAPEKVIDTDLILSKINNVVEKLDPQLQAQDIADIDEMMQILSTKGDKLNLNELFKVKEFLQNRSQGSFMKDGKIFALNDAAKRAAKSGFNEAKSILDQVSPEIRNANKQLSTLHMLESKMNPSLLKAGAPESSFLAAGTGLNQRNRNVLKQIGDITGTDPVKVAEDLVTSRSFAAPPVLPVDTTGKSFTRQNLGRLASGALLGAGVGSATGQDEKTLAIIGAAISSPAALKKVIQSGTYGSDMIKAAIKSLNNEKFRSVVAREAGKIGIDTMRVKRRLQKELKND